MIQQPVFPNEPKGPKHPEKKISMCYSIDIRHNSLGSILDQFNTKFKNINPHDIFFDIEYSGCDNAEIPVAEYHYEQDNPDYENQLLLYETNLKGYNKRMKKHKEVWMQYVEDHMVWHEDEKKRIHESKLKQFEELKKELGV